MRNPTIRPTHAVIPAMVLAAGLAAGPGAHGAQAQSAGELPQRADVLLAGSITDAAGEPMEGVVVSVRATASNLTTSVYTDGDGEYVFPRTAAGSYQLWAQAVSYEAGRADPELRGAMQRQDFVLESLENFEAQLPGDRWVAALPEDTPEDRRMKTVFRVSCGGCHSQNTALLTRFDEQGWLNIITVMSRIATAGWVASPMAPGPAREDRPPSPLMDYYKERLARYLAKVLGPGPSPMNFVPRPRPTGDAVLAVIREYDTPGQGYGLPMWEDGTNWIEGAPSKTSRKNHHAMDGTLDFDGNLYFSDDLNTNPYRSVGKIDAATGLVTNVHVPRRRTPEMASAVHDLIADQEGTLWFGADGRLIALDPDTLEWEAVTTPDGELVRAGGFHDKDGLGGVWGAVRGGAIRYDPGTRTATEYRNPIQKDKRGSAGTYGMAGDRDGNGWLSQYGFDVMVKHEYATGESYSIQLPQSPYAPPDDLFVGDDRRIFDMMGGSLFHGRGHPWMHTIRKPGGGEPSNAAWGPGWTSDHLVKIDIETHDVTLYPFPYRDGGCYQAVVDLDGIVWTVFTNADAVGRFDPESEEWTWYDLPTVGTESHGLQVVTVDGRTQVGVPYWGSSKMAKLEFLTADEREALKVAAAPPAAGGVEAETVRYASGSAEIAGYLARPAGDGGRRPAVVLVHDDQGLTDAVRNAVRFLAAEGFVVLAPDLVSRLPDGPAPAPGGRPAARVARLPLEATVQDVTAAFEFLAGDPEVDAERISAVGFGWGGWRTWKLAERTPALHRAVVFYGTTSDDRRLDRIRTPVLGHYAEYDFQTTAQALATKRRLGERFAYHVYPDMDRGFAGGGSGAIDYVALVRGRDGGAAESTDEGAPAAVADAVRLAWERTLSFLR